MKSYKTIGFFGDSFCADSTNLHSLTNSYKTYIKKLEKHFNIKTVNLGHGGSSVWDSILLQLKPFIDSDTVPDICVFIWTHRGRLFNRKIRRLNSTDVRVKSFGPFKQSIANAAKEFYIHLYDEEKEQLEYLAILRYVDQVILPSLPSTTKIIHLWSTGNLKEWQGEGFYPSNISYTYDWIHGTEIRPSLISLSLYDNDVSILSSDRRANHLDGDFKNELLFNWIRTAIEDSDDNQDHSELVETFFNKKIDTDTVT
jgi:hypothetical protein